MPSSSLNWQLVVLLLAIVGAATFLAYGHDLSEQTVSTIFGAVLSGVLVGHYTSKGPGA